MKTVGKLCGYGNDWVMNTLQAVSATRPFW
jgi:hypothetical protein